MEPSLHPDTGLGGNFQLPQLALAQHPASPLWAKFSKTGIICDNPSMEVSVEQAGSEAVVRLSGKLVAGSTDAVYEEVRRLIPVSKKIVLDLTDLSYMDSMGLGTLIRLYVSATSSGCDLELVNLSKRIRELLGLTNLLSVFTICGEHTIRMP